MDARATRVLTREELYELVWTIPVRTLAKRYGLSDQGLAKKCKKHAIPRPPLGYWQKLAAGRPRVDLQQAQFIQNALGGVGELQFGALHCRSGDLC